MGVETGPEQKPKAQPDQTASQPEIGQPGVQEFRRTFARPDGKVTLASPAGLFNVGVTRYEKDGTTGETRAVQVPITETPGKDGQPNSFSINYDRRHKYGIQVTTDSPTEQEISRFRTARLHGFTHFNGVDMPVDEGIAEFTRLSQTDKRRVSRLEAVHRLGSDKHIALIENNGGQKTSYVRAGRVEGEEIMDTQTKNFQQTGEDTSPQSKAEFTVHPSDGFNDRSHVDIRQTQVTEASQVRPDGSLAEAQKTVTERGEPVAVFDLNLIQHDNSITVDTIKDEKGKNAYMETNNYTVYPASSESSQAEKA